ncbi:aspartic peptidase domain-containing protein [Irpex lacteus]|nr:aspartic peptidase domain-containing protein [Irpex lacteus]
MKGALLAGFAATLLSEAYAARPLPFGKRASTTGASFSAQRGTGLVPHRGASKTLSTQAQGSSLSDDSDLLYLLNITLGGTTFTCQIDTGSSDLWVIPPNHHPLKTTNETQVAAAIEYADGSGVSGLVDFAELLVGGYTVPSQAFINPNKTKNVAQLLDADAGMNCLIGLSFDLLSEVNNNIIAAFGNTTLGQTPLSNIFDQNPSLPNCLDIHLQRSDDLESTGSGLILIGEHSDEHGNITAQPILNTVAETEWVVEVDAITVAGKSLKFEESAVPGLEKSKKLGGLLDSGSSALILPDKMVNEVFKSIPNSFYSKEQGTWIVDCLSSTNVSITMGGIDYHVHPLDLTRLSQFEVTDKGKKENITVCSSFVDPVGDSCGDGCDLIMGDVFLRNTITSFNFGNWTHASTPNDGSFIQLLPLTNQSDAWSDFLETRKANLKSLPRAPPIYELRLLLAEQSDDGSSDSTDSSTTDDSSTQHLTTSGGGAKAALADDTTSDNSQLVSLVEKYGPVIIGLLAGNILIGVLLLVVGIATCLRKQSVKARSISPSYAPVRFKEADSGLDSSYRDD